MSKLTRLTNLLKKLFFYRQESNLQSFNRLGSSSLGPSFNRVGSSSLGQSTVVSGNAVDKTSTVAVIDLMEDESSNLNVTTMSRKRKPETIAAERQKSRENVYAIKTKNRFDLLDSDEEDDVSVDLLDSDEGDCYHRNVGSEQCGQTK